MTHKLKTVNPWFTDIWEGRKSFEYRRNDREFQVGDTLVLHEWVDAKATGREVRADVTYLYHCGDGYCVMQIEVTGKKDAPKVETIDIDVPVYPTGTTLTTEETVGPPMAADDAMLRRLVAIRTYLWT